MFTNSLRTLCAILLLATVGCQDDQSAATVESTDPAATSSDAASPSKSGSKESEKTHQHSEDDVLVWVQRDIEDGDFVISLGHHGVHFHGGDEIEPAVTITKGGQDVPDAVVHNSLIAEDGETVLAEEKPTVFEPKTEHEPAHYAQGALLIPKDTEKFMLRFRIKLPGIDAESAYDIEQEVSH
jgi:hypothetical protein